MTGRWQRRAEINKTAIVVLVVLVVLAGGYWLYRGVSHEKLEVKPDAPVSMLQMHCNACKERFEMPASEVQAFEENDQGYKKCPKCGEFALGGQQRKGGTALTP